MNGILKRTLRGERGRFAPGGPSIRPSFDQLRTNGLMVEPRAVVTRFNIPFALSLSKPALSEVEGGERDVESHPTGECRTATHAATLLSTNGLMVELKAAVTRFNFPFALSLSKGEREFESHSISECRTATHATTLLRRMAGHKPVGMKHNNGC